MKPALNLPNQITLARLILAILFFVVLAQYSQQAPKAWVLDLAIALFIVAAGSDYIDGYLARKWGLVTPLGRVLDPLVDKVLVCGAFIFFVGPNFVDASGRNATTVESWMVIVIVGRELLVSGLRGDSEAKGKAYGASLHGKLKMWMQSIAAPIVLFVIAHEALVGGGANAERIKFALVWLTVIITAASAFQYLSRSWHLVEESAPK